jgi:hypothetical protein
VPRLARVPKSEKARPDVGFVPGALARTDRIVSAMLWARASSRAFRWPEKFRPDGHHYDEMTMVSN